MASVAVVAILKLFYFRSFSPLCQQHQENIDGQIKRRKMSGLTSDDDDHDIDWPFRHNTQTPTFNRRPWFPLVYYRLWQPSNFNFIGFDQDILLAVRRRWSRSARRPSWGWLPIKVCLHERGVGERKRNGTVGSQLSRIYSRIALLGYYCTSMNL